MNVLLLLEGVLMLPMALVGMFLNIASIFYFASCHHQRPFHRLLMTLAGVDTVYLITSSLSFSIKHLSQSYKDSAWKLIVPYSLPLAQTSMTASVYLTVSLTIERYFSIVKPLYQLRNRWLRSSLILSIPGMLFSLLFTLPNYFMLSTVWKTVPVYEDIQANLSINQTFVDQWSDSSPYIQINSSTGENITLARVENRTMILVGERLEPQLEFAKFRDNEIYIKVYVMWLHFIFNSVFPLSILLTLNTSIYRKLAKIPEHMRRSTEQSLRKRELRLARISLLIVFIFILCHTPKVFPSTFEIFGHDPYLVPALVEISHLLLTVNSSVNFLVYYLACGRNICYLFRPSSVRRRNTRMSQREQSTIVSHLNEPLANTSFHFQIKENDVIIERDLVSTSSLMENTML